MDAAGRLDEPLLAFEDTPPFSLTSKAPTCYADTSFDTVLGALRCVSTAIRVIHLPCCRFELHRSPVQVVCFRSWQFRLSCGQALLRLMPSRAAMQPVAWRKRNVLLLVMTFLMTVWVLVVLQHNRQLFLEVPECFPNQARMGPFCFVVSIGLLCFPVYSSRSYSWSSWCLPNTPTPTLRADFRQSGLRKPWSQLMLAWAEPFIAVRPSV